MILPRAADVLTRATAEMATLVPRYCTSYQYRYRLNGCYRSTSAWSRYGRWILAGILILIGVVALLLFLCVAARRRRSARKFQATPMTNNANTAYYPPQQQNFGQQNQYAPPAGAPPPTYAGNYGNDTHGANEGYYGQQNGVSQPANTYQK